MQLLWSGPSLVKAYRVIPFPSTRICPSLASVATIIVGTVAAAAGVAVGAVELAGLTGLPSGETTNQTLPTSSPDNLTWLSVLDEVVQRHMVVGNDLFDHWEVWPMPISEASTPGPNFGVPEETRGGQLAWQFASQFTVSGPSLVKIYRVFPLPSTRIFPKVGFVARSIVMLSELPVAADCVGAGGRCRGTGSQDHRQELPQGRSSLPVLRLFCNYL